jgi:hypothetical protein
VAWLRSMAFRMALNKHIVAEWLRQELDSARFHGLDRHWYVTVTVLVPVKLGLKNVKAITRITYVAEEPRDYWAERGYSRYDGI